jgi:glycosyltransferase involved in cell wall biosynthesis
MWRHGSAAVALLESDLRRRVRDARPDVVLQVQDLGVVEAPYLVLQDLSFGLLLERYGADGVPHFRTLGRRRVEGLRRRQDEVYAGAATLLPMSRWLAESLVEGGVDRDRVHVVNPGINADMPGSPVPVRRQGPAQRLLMIGRDFDTKGGAQVVEAFGLLRSDLGPAVSLTIAGPPAWPLRGDVPDGVTFLGPVPRARVAELLDSHDLFVMPSLFEGFGIAFAEALARGLPCIGRDDCAMPEIIDPESGGRLVTSQDPHELATLIVDALADDKLYELCAQEAPVRRGHYSWDRAAVEVTEAVERVRR